MLEIKECVIISRTITILKSDCHKVIMHNMYTSLCSYVTWMFSNTAIKSPHSQMKLKEKSSTALILISTEDSRVPEHTWILYFITNFEGSSTLNLLTFLNYLYKLAAIYLVAKFVRLFHCWNKNLLNILQNREVLIFFLIHSFTCQFVPSLVSGLLVWQYTALFF